MRSITLASGVGPIHEAHKLKRPRASDNVRAFTRSARLPCLGRYFAILLRQIRLSAIRYATDLCKAGPWS
eukprot:5613629-Pyramimonas_sp.AAC.1